MRHIINKLCSIVVLSIFVVSSIVGLAEAGSVWRGGKFGIVKDYTKDPDCVGAWYMNGASSGDETDRSINGETLTCTGAVGSVGVAPHDGYTGLARNNFAATRYLSHADGGSTDIATNRITVCAWVYRTLATGTDIICSKRGATGQRAYQVALTATTLRLRLSSDGTAESDVSKTLPITTLNKWVHIACTYDGTQMVFYVNGVVIGKQSVSTEIFNSNKQFEVGGDTTSVDGFTGNIDEFIIFNQAKTQKQITEMMYKGIDGTKGING